MPRKKNTKRSDGRIAVQIYLGIGEDGKRKYKTVYGTTQKEADEKAAELKAQLGKGLDISSKNKTFQDWAKLFLSTQKTALSESEYSTKEKRISFFYSYFGGSPIEAVRPFQIEAALTALAKENPSTGKPTAKKTLAAYKQGCSQVFKFAIKNRIIDHNPVDYAETPKNAPKNERRALSETERRWIAELDSKQRAKRAAMIAMFCGLRRGEMTALTWNDIDFEKKTITVNKSYDFKNNVLKLPKTAAGIRTVPMPDTLVDFLKSEKRTSIYVIVTAKNKMMSVDSWKRAMQSLLVDIEIAHGTAKGKEKKKKKCEPKPTVFTLQPFGWHDLRHTYATLLFEAGVDILTAQYLLGHESPQTTMEIYTHLSDEQKERSIVKLNDFLSSKNECKSNASQTG